MLTSNGSSKFLASRLFRILSFCCFSRLPIPFPSTTGRNCRKATVKLTKLSNYKGAWIYRRQISSQGKNLSIFASLLKRFLARQLFVKLSTASSCCRSHTSNILEIFLLSFSRQISFSSCDGHGRGSKLYMAA